MPCLCFGISLLFGSSWLSLKFGNGTVVECVTIPHSPQHYAVHLTFYCVEACLVFSSEFTLWPLLLFGHFSLAILSPLESSFRFSMGTVV